MPAPKFRMRGTTAASETEATQKKTSTAPKFRMRGAGGGTSPSLPTVTSQAVGETAGRKKPDGQQLPESWVRSHPRHGRRSAGRKSCGHCGMRLTRSF